MSGQRIAIIGSGIAGLTTAHLLQRQHDVTVFEANDYIGGHTHTVPVESNGRTVEVDTGFIVCNDRNYPSFLRFMDKLGVQLQPTEMSFSVRNDADALEYNGHNLNTLFCQRRNLLRPSFIRFVRDILTFNKLAKQALEEDRVGDQTLDDFISNAGLGPMLRDNYLLPMVAAIWSCSVRQAGGFPLRFFLQFFLNHGLLDVRNRPQWYVLKGGSHAYIEPMTRGFRDRIHLSTPVQAVRRHETGIEVNTAAGSTNFDQVVMACHSDQALSLLADATSLETQILGDIGYQDNDVILHRDASIMPSRSLAWASWNFLAGEGNEASAPVVTYSMNILQGLPRDDTFLVTLNAADKIDPDKIIQRFNYAHPVYSTASQRAQQRREEICGQDRIHYCGAYWYNGFHEDGVRSALDVCQRFGESL
ncbi:unnamed protein product [Discosporangium mesarthrocarpum]